MNVLHGQRLSDASIYHPRELDGDIAPGSYWRVDRGAVGLIPQACAWIARFPCGKFLTLNTGVRGRVVVEHDDDTISVDGLMDTGAWAGYLKHGVWSQEERP